MKIYLKYIFLFLIAGSIFSSCNQKDEKVYSFWALQNRATGEYLYEDDGECKFSREKQGDKSLWKIAAAEGDHVCIVNKKSGRYLSLDNGQVVCSVVDQPVTESAEWYYGNFDFVTQTNSGWYTISNRSAESNLHLVEKDGTLCMQDNANRNTDFSAHWTWVREEGTPLPYSFTPDGVTDASFLGIRTAKAISPTEIHSDYHGEKVWKLSQDISSFPKFSTENNLLIEALYNMALEEMLMDVRSDSSFRAGALWPDTWTRDAVYSIWFSYAWIMPEVSRKTLDKQTLRNPREALQDTGSGGSWPISTDRVVWALAAWEYYLYTGDSSWLEGAYEGLSYTARKDIHVAFDKRIGLFKGETCSMDWRTHTYPNWFTNVTIGSSFSCGTNALHMFMYEFLSKTAGILGKPESEKTYWESFRNVLKDSINKHFWNEDKGLYECYLYPEISGYKASERVGVMSNGLCAVLGASTDEQIRRMVGNFPLYPYGAAVLYPSIPDDFAYHNKSVWPVWQTPYMYAARQVGNISAVEHMAASLTRASALFLTHKENMTYDTGYDRGTALNSDRQLWSVSSYISLVYRVLFGMNLTERGIAFNPVVPDIVNGWLSLSDFRYRDATIDIKVSGKGNRVKSLKVNGEKQALPFVLPADSKGEYSIEIEMMIDEPKGKINLVKAGPGKCWSPVEPVLVLNGSTLSWKEEENMKYYLHSNFSEVDKLVTSPYDLIGAPDGFYSVYAVDEKGFASDMSNAVVYSTWQSVCEAEQSSHSGTVSNLHKGFSGSGFVIDLFARPANAKFQVQVPEAGDYAIALRGANGHGPHGTWCAIRSVAVDGNDAGTFILEATGDWKQWLDSNYIVLRGLNAGEHTVSLSIDPEKKGYDFNMSHGREDANDCHIDCLKLIRL